MINILLQYLEIEIIKTIKDLCNIIYQIENKYNLIDFKISGVFIWQFLRMQIYYKLGEKVGLLEQPHTKISRFQKLFYIFSYLKSILFHNPFVGDHKVYTLIFDHERHKIVNNEKIDIYTKYLIDNLKNRNIKYNVLEKPYLGKHYKKVDKNRKHLDLFSLINIITSPLINVSLTKSQKKFIKNIENEIESKLNISIDLKNMFIKSIKRFKVNHFLYKKLFKKRKPTKIYCVVSYGMLGDMIKAAKDQGIEVIELQHGIISKYHLGYYYPNGATGIEYFPDKFYAWDKYWSEIIDLPIKKENIVEFGFKYLEIQKKLYNKYDKIKNQIAIISQGVIGPQIADIVNMNIQNLSKYKLKYKLHPGEYERWKEYKSLLKFTEYDNVEILYDVDLYKILAESEYQIGVFSTALYEGLEFGCNTILLDLPGVEYMNDLILKFNIPVTNDISKALKQYSIIK